MHKKIITYVALGSFLLFSIFIYINQKFESDIGIVLPATGRFANISEDVLHGIDIATQDLSVQNIYTEDTSGEATKAVSALQNLLHTKKVKLVISGPGGSTSNLAMSSTINTEQVPLLAISSTPTLREKKDYIFMLHPSIESEVQAMIRYLKEKNIKKVAVLYDNSSDTQTLANTIFVKEFIKESGQTITMSEGYGKDVDYKTISTKVLSTNPEAVYIIAVDKIAGPLVKQLREQKYKGMLTGFSVADSAEFLKSAGIYSEGFTISALPFECERTEKTKQYCAEYTKRFNRIPTAFGAYAYDTLTFANNALKTCTVADMQKCLLTFDHSTIDYLTEGFSIDQNGDLPIDVPIYTKQVIGGVFKKI